MTFDGSLETLFAVDTELEVLHAAAGLAFLQGLHTRLHTIQQEALHSMLSCDVNNTLAMAQYQHLARVAEIMSNQLADTIKLASTGAPHKEK